MGKVQMRAPLKRDGRVHQLKRGQKVMKTVYLSKLPKRTWLSLAENTPYTKWTGRGLRTREKKTLAFSNVPGSPRGGDQGPATARKTNLGGGRQTQKPCRHSVRDWDFQKGSDHRADRPG